MGVLLSKHTESVGLLLKHKEQHPSQPHQFLQCLSPSHLNIGFVTDDRPSFLLQVLRTDQSIGLITEMAIGYYTVYKSSTLLNASFCEVRLSEDATHNMGQLLEDLRGFDAVILEIKKSVKDSSLKLAHALIQQACPCAACISPGFNVPHLLGSQPPTLLQQLQGREPNMPAFLDKDVDQLICNITDQLHLSFAIQRSKLMFTPAESASSNNNQSPPASKIKTTPMLPHLESELGQARTPGSVSGVGSSTSWPTPVVAPVTIQAGLGSKKQPSLVRSLASVGESISTSGKNAFRVPPPTALQQPRTPIPNHVGITGSGQVGKSSLINSLLHIPETDPKAAPVSEEGTAASCASYTGASKPGVTIWEIPYQEQYLAKLSDMSAVCVVIGDRMLSDDVRMVQHLHLNGIPFVLVRSKADIAIAQVKRRKKHMDDAEAKNVLRQEVATICKIEDVRHVLTPESILLLSAWKLDSGHVFMDEESLWPNLQKLMCSPPGRNH